MGNNQTTGEFEDRRKSKAFVTHVHRYSSPPRITLDLKLHTNSSSSSNRSSINSSPRSSSGKLKKKSTTPSSKNVNSMILRKSRSMSVPAGGIAPLSVSKQGETSTPTLLFESEEQNSITPRKKLSHNHLLESDSMFELQQGSSSSSSHTNSPLHIITKVKRKNTQRSISSSLSNETPLAEEASCTIDPIADASPNTPAAAISTPRSRGRRGKSIAHSLISTLKDLVSSPHNSSTEEMSQHRKSAKVSKSVTASGASTPKRLSFRKSLSQEEKSYQKSNHVRILMLGCGESGKSSICKKLKYMFGNQQSLPLQELMEEYNTHWKAILFANLVFAMRELVKVRNHYFSSESWTNEEVAINCCNLISEYDITLFSQLTFDASGFVRETTYAKLANAMEYLWNQEPSIQKAWPYRNVDASQFPYENAQNYFSCPTKLLQQHFHLSQEEIIKSYSKTCGSTAYKFHVPQLEAFQNGTVELLDGQRSERRKWARMLEKKVIDKRFISSNIEHDTLNHGGNVDCIIFVVSLSEFDQTCSEDLSSNRMVESMKVLDKNVLNEPAFHNIPVYLIFTKEELMKEKYELYQKNGIMEHVMVPSYESALACEALEPESQYSTFTPLSKFTSPEAVLTHIRAQYAKIMMKHAHFTQFEEQKIQTFIVNVFGNEEEFKREFESIINAQLLWKRLNNFQQ